MAEVELPADTLPKLKTANEQIKVLETFINKAKIAKIDVSDAETRLKTLKSQLNDVRTGFFPNESL